MRKIVVDNIQSPSGTSIFPFGSNSTSNVVFKDSTDGIFKDVNFPDDAKAVRSRETGTSAQYIEIPLQDSGGNVTEGLNLKLVYNYLNQLQEPQHGSSNYMALKIYVKDSSGSVMNSTDSFYYSSAKHNNYTSTESDRSSSEDFIFITGGAAAQSNTTDWCSWRDVFITVFEDSNIWNVFLDYSGVDPTTANSNYTNFVFGNGHLTYDTGTPHTLVIETNATVGNRENAVSVWNTKGDL